MQLMTEEIKERLLANWKNRYSMNEESEVVVKYFNPYGPGTWLIVAGKEEGDTMRLYGKYHICEWEWGDVMLKDLEGIRSMFGGIERDLHCEGSTVEQLERHW